MSLPEMLSCRHELVQWALDHFPDLHKGWMKRHLMLKYAAFEGNVTVLQELGHITYPECAFAFVMDVPTAAATGGHLRALEWLDIGGWFMEISTGTECSSNYRRLSLQLSNP